MVVQGGTKSILGGQYMTIHEMVNLGSCLSYSLPDRANWEDSLSGLYTHASWTSLI